MTQRLSSVLALLALAPLLAPAQIGTNIANLDPTVGTKPRGNLLPLGRNFYFTCEQGGTDNDGTIAAYIPGSGVVKLADLLALTTGKNPYGSMVAVGNDLYFTCKTGGTSNSGTLSK